MRNSDGAKRSRKSSSYFPLVGHISIGILFFLVLTEVPIVIISFFRLATGPTFCELLMPFVDLHRCNSSFGFLYV